MGVGGGGASFMNWLYFCCSCLAYRQNLAGGMGGRDRGRIGMPPLRRLCTTGFLYFRGISGTSGLPSQHGVVCAVLLGEQVDSLLTELTLFGETVEPAVD